MSRLASSVGKRIATLEDEAYNEEKVINDLGAEGSDAVLSEPTEENTGIPGESGQPPEVASAADDISFEVVVSTDGSRATFRLPSGADPAVVVAAFCEENVDEGNLAACSSSLTSAVAKAFSQRKVSSAQTNRRPFVPSTFNMTCRCGHRKMLYKKKLGVTLIQYLITSVVPAPPKKSILLAQLLQLLVQ